MLRREDDKVVGRVLTMELAGTRGRVMPARRWKLLVEYDMRVMGLEKGGQIIETREGDKSSLVDFHWQRKRSEFKFLRCVFVLGEICHRPATALYKEDV